MFKNDSIMGIDRVKPSLKPAASAEVSMVPTTPLGTQDKHEQQPADSSEVANASKQNEQEDSE